jgi:hypothetical protein
MTHRAPISQKNTATVKDNIDSATNTNNNCLGAKLQLRASFQCRLADERSPDKPDPSNCAAASIKEPADHVDEVLTDMLRYCFQHCFNRSCNRFFNITQISGNNCAF